MKKIISIFLLLATVATVSAQRFEWAKGYNAAQENLNSITGAVVDSLGNLYIMGYIRRDAEWDGECIFPEFYSPCPFSDINTIIAKISPEGEMLWRKLVVCFNGGASIPDDIKLIGDTAVVCLFDFMYPGYCADLYYLDTLVTWPSEYPCAAGRFYDREVVACVSFDFDGNVTDEHFLRLSPVDNDGNDFYFYDIMPNDTIAYIRNLFMDNFKFCINEDGIIYIYRQANDILNDSLNAWNGAFSAIKVWDGIRLVGTFPVEGRHYEWEQHILKFAPHFDTLLASRYVIQQCDSVVYHLEYPYPSLQIDNNSNLYSLATLNGIKRLDNCLIIDSTQNIRIYNNGYNHLKGYLVKYDSNLNVKWVVDFEDSVISSNTQWSSSTAFPDMAFDKDSNFLFLYAGSNRGVFGDTTNFFSILMYQGIPFKLKNDAFVVAFNNTDTQPTIHSYCRVPAITESSFKFDVLSTQNLACINNRIFIQSKYFGGLRYNNIYQPAESIFDANLGLFIFDYAGHVITHNNFDIDIRGKDCNGPLVLRDSILYLMTAIKSHATFGDTTVYAWGQLACIAKYVDTSFMTPYVHPVPDAGIRPAIDMPRVTIYPNPVTNQLSISSEKPVAPQAYIINSVGIRMPATVQDNRIDVSRLKPGIYILELYVNNQLSTTKFIKL